MQTTIITASSAAMLTTVYQSTRFTLQNKTVSPMYHDMLLIVTDYATYSTQNNSILYLTLCHTLYTKSSF